MHPDNFDQRSENRVKLDVKVAADRQMRLTRAKVGAPFTLVIAC